MNSSRENAITGQLAKAVTDHILTYENINMLLAIVNTKRKANHFWGNLASSSPCLNNSA